MIDDSAAASDLETSVSDLVTMPDAIPEASLESPSSIAEPATAPTSSFAMGDFYNWADNITSNFITSEPPQLVGQDIDSLVVISKSFINLLLNYPNADKEKALTYFDDLEVIKRKLGY